MFNSSVSICSGTHGFFCIQSFHSRNLTKMFKENGEGGGCVNIVLYSYVISFYTKSYSCLFYGCNTDEKNRHYRCKV